MRCETASQLPTMGSDATTRETARGSLLVWRGTHTTASHHECTRRPSKASSGGRQLSRYVHASLNHQPPRAGATTNTSYGIATNTPDAERVISTRHAGAIELRGTDTA